MNADKILKLLKFLFWIIFIILCLRTCFDIYYSFLGSSQNSSEYFERSNTWYYITSNSLNIIVSIAKTYLAYLVTKIFTKINFNNPFNITTSKLLIKISYAALSTGVLALITNAYSMWLYKLDLLNIISDPYQPASGEFLFLGAIIYIISQIFKKGTEIQSENELTV